MVHGDDKGLVLPPRVAPTQVVVVPIPKDDVDPASLDECCAELERELRDAGVRVEVDRRRNHRPGWKYNYWELKGVPLRIEIGPRDLQRRSCRIVRRDTGAKTDRGREDVAAFVGQELERMHADMLQAATVRRDAGIARVTHWDEVAPALQARKLILAPWCETEESERAIREATHEEVPVSPGSPDHRPSGSMKSLCIPLEQPPLAPGTPCFFTGQPAKRWCLFGRSY